jgi:pyridoxal phosphate enzyme (YggS family)
VDPLPERYRELRRRLPAGVALLAVSKGRPAAMVRALHAEGQRSFGESRLQEAVAKQAELADLPDLDWQFIGRLQANKVRPVLRAFAAVQSVDSLDLARRISRIADEEGLQPVLHAQVKLRPDPAKGGFEPEELRQHWDELRQLPAVRWQGLMAIPPLGLEEGELGALFREAVSLADALGLEGRSLGMSGDWPLAVAAGSTLVRLGSTLFGPLSAEGSRFAER